jgi:DNA-binding HxlR family transcriptional regulator
MSWRKAAPPGRLRAAGRPPQRHAELRRRVPGITQKMLTETLRSMQADGLAERRVLKDTAPSTSEPLAAICAWAAEHA